MCDVQYLLNIVETLYYQQNKLVSSLILLQILFSITHIFPSYFEWSLFLADEASSKALKTTKFPCYNCNGSFSSKGALKTHEKKKHGKQIHTFFKEIGAFCGHKELHNKRRAYECMQRGQVSLTVHEGLHQTEKSVHSKDCGKSLLAESHHDPRFQCAVCKSVFETLIDLHKHKLTHQKSKNCPVVKSGRQHKCTKCGKTFTTVEMFNKHLALHKEKSDKSNICSQRVYTSIQEKKHKNQHQKSKTGDVDRHISARTAECTLTSSLVKNHQTAVLHCKECYKSFANSTHLSQHHCVIVPSEIFSCNLCFEEFLSKGDLEAHKVSHTREQFFQCDVCWKCFGLKHQLESHKISHFQEPLFQCPVCYKFFGLQHHLATHTFVCTKSVSSTDQRILKS